MRLRALRLALAVVAMALVPSNLTHAQTLKGHYFGPAPEWEQFRRIAEAEVLSRLIDPESARFAWLGGYYKGEFKVILGERTQGYVACGTVNSKNRMGGYVGATGFVVVIDYDRVLFVEMDSRSAGSIAYQCSQMQNAGRFPPLPAAQAEPTLGSKTSTSIATGLSLRAMPEGAYVSEVTPGGPATIAGLKPGMVITSVNAVPLAGMGDAMLAVINAAGPAATVTVIGGGTFKLGGGP